MADLEAAFAPLTELARGDLPHPAARLAEAHAAVAEKLARDASGSSSGLWQGDAGEALSVLLAELIDAGHGLALTRRRLSAVLSQPGAGEVVRPRAALHPRLFIWGPLEARLQQPDLVILGSLNEGVWPRHQEAGPWLSRPMREALGLAPRSGASALPRTISPRRLGRARSISPARTRWTACRPCRRAGCSGCCLGQSIGARAEDRARAALGPMGARARHADGFDPAEPPKTVPAGRGPATAT